MQTRGKSFIESLVNVAIGYITALLSQLIIFPLVGIDVSFRINIEIGLYFTAISIVRSYLVRRLFNG
jgi:hypothetical protein